MLYNQYLHIFFQTRDLFKVFQVVPTTLLNFLTTLENHYLKSVPYHNNLHAADVTQSIHVLLNSPALEVNKEFLMKFPPALTIFSDYFFLWQFQLGIHTTQNSYNKQTKISGLETNIFVFEMMIKSGLDFFYFEIPLALQRYLLTSQADPAFLGRFFWTGQQQFLIIYVDFWPPILHFRTQTACCTRSKCSLNTK